MTAIFSTFVLMALLLAGAYTFSTQQQEAEAMATVEAETEKNPGVTDLETALRTAKTAGKFTFVKLGRTNCGNCRALQKLIDTNRVPLPPSKFVFADISTDDASQNKAFFTRFNMSGDMLPFVVIADEQGRMLVSRSGYGTEKDFTQLLKEADVAKAAGKYVLAPTPPQPEASQAPQPSAAVTPATFAPPTQEGKVKKYY